ncbi:hypothetical protein EU527_12155 [Candidatus Thorarchaeota archaeon]|nr:MAG: hypothetical protein EU527_12155 [Candidatus Thorarchaeota archaeon]
MNRIIHERRRLRRQINSNERLDKYLHFYITAILSINMVLILFAMLSVTIRMSLNGVGFFDSMPIALYILPLMIFLPLMIRAFYRNRTSAWNFVFLVISSVFFSMLSLLVRGFVFCVVLNLVAVVSIFIIGRFRPQGNLRQAGKKGIAYILLMNMLSLTFPVSIIVMGQIQIAATSTSTIPEIILGVPLADFDFPYSYVNPTPSIISDLEVSQFGVDLRVLENDDDSWFKLTEWLHALNESSVLYTVTLTSDRALFVGETPTAIGTTDVIRQVFTSHRNAITNLTESLDGIINYPSTVIFDLTLSQQEWQKLMFHTRSLDLIGFTGLMRSSIYSTDVSVIDQESTLLAQEASNLGIQLGILIESFVLDDLQDNDNVAMRLAGVSISSLNLWDTIQVSCSRSRFSLEMRGDVEAYLVESYSESVAIKGSKWTMRLGDVGNDTDIEDRPAPVYETFDILNNDIKLAAGNGVDTLTIDSLSSLLSSFGPNAIIDFHESLSTTHSGSSRYTFRIYAYRAVFIAIDSFDILLL